MLSALRRWWRGRIWVKDRVSIRPFDVVNRPSAQPRLAGRRVVYRYMWSIVRPCPHCIRRQHLLDGGDPALYSRVAERVPINALPYVRGLRISCSTLRTSIIRSLPKCMNNGLIVRCQVLVGGLSTTQRAAVGGLVSLLPTSRRMHHRDGLRVDIACVILEWHDIIARQVASVTRCYVKRVSRTELGWGDHRLAIVIIHQTSKARRISKWISIDQNILAV